MGASPVEYDSVRSAAVEIAAIVGLVMDPDDLIDDVLLLAISFDDQQEFDYAVLNTVKAMMHLIDGTVKGTPLRGELWGLKSFHYQHKVMQRAKADCRVVYSETEDGIDVRMFGHRYIPGDIYERLLQSR